MKIEKITDNTYRAFENGQIFCASDPEKAKNGLRKLMERNLMLSKMGISIKQKKGKYGLR